MKPSVVYQTREVLVLTPDALLEEPCKASPAGDSVKTLAKAYVQNTSCIGLYKKLLDKQIEHKHKMQELYKDGR